MKGINNLKDIGKLYNPDGARTIKRGDLYYIHNDDKITGSEQPGGRPAVVVGNDIGNEKSPVIIIVYTTAQEKKELPTHVDIDSLPQRSTVLCEQIVTVGRDRVGRYAGRVTDEEMARIDKALAVSIDLKKYKGQTAETFITNGNDLLEKAKLKVDEIIAAAKKVNQTEEILQAAKNSTAICFSGEGIIKLDDVISEEQVREIREFALKQIEAGKESGEKRLADLLGEQKVAVPAVKVEKPENKTPQPAKTGRKSKLDLGKMMALKKAGWSVKEIADELKCSEGAVYNNIKKCS